MVKNLPAMQETRVWSLGWEDPLEKGMATHSSTLAWRIPWTEGPDRLPSMGSQGVGHNWATNTNTFPVAYWTPSDEGAHLSVSYLFAFSYCSWTSHARILEWVAISSSSGPHSVRTLHYNLFWVALHSMVHSFTELCKPLSHDKAVIHEGYLVLKCSMMLITMTLLILVLWSHPSNVTAV